MSSLPIRFDSPAAPSAPQVKASFVTLRYITFITLHALHASQVTVSFGNTSSLVSLPCFMSHASIPPEVRKARGLPDDLVRISAGIEAKQDLIADLEQAMTKAAAETGVAYTPATSLQGIAGSAFTVRSYA